MNDREQSDGSFGQVSDLPLHDPSYFPAVRDASRIAGIWVQEQARRSLAERALLRLGPAASKAIQESLERVTPKLQADLFRLLVRADPEGALPVASLLLTTSPHVGLRRAAARALGRRGMEGGLPLLIKAASGCEADPSVLAQMRASIAQIGGKDAESFLQAAQAEGVSLMKARRNIDRDESLPTLRSKIHLYRPHPVRIGVRRGGEAALAEEIRQRFPTAQPILDQGAVCFDVHERAEHLYKLRTALFVHWHVADIGGSDPESELNSLAEKLLGESMLELRKALSEDTGFRYRIDWEEGDAEGKRVPKKRVEQLAALLHRLDPSLINAPSEAPWTLCIRRIGSRVRVDLAAKKPSDLFGYRVARVPAASHPTIAAILVRVARVRAEDVVWDPFVGGATELIECWKQVEPRLLLGTDVDPLAIEAARTNRSAAGIPDDRLQLTIQSALDGVPPCALTDGNGSAVVRPTLVLSNPPMGRRVHRSASLRPMLEGFLNRLPTILAPEGRMVWLSPFPDLALPKFLQREVWGNLDLGGFEAALEVVRHR